MQKQHNDGDEDNYGAHSYRISSGAHLGINVSVPSAFRLAAAAAAAAAVPVE